MLWRSAIVMGHETFDSDYNMQTHTVTDNVLMSNKYLKIQEYRYTFTVLKRWQGTLKTIIFNLKTSRFFYPCLSPVLTET